MNKPTQKQIKIAELKNNSYNPNLMNEDYFSAIKSNIKADGFLQPILVNNIDGEYIVIDGEHRLKAMKELGYKDINCWVISVSEGEAKRLTLKMGLHGSYNLVDLSALVDQMLTDEQILLKNIVVEMPHIDLKELDIDCNFEGDIGNGAGSGSNEKDDEVPEIEDDKEPFSKLGDVWMLGKHKILCGDSIYKSNIELLMGTHKNKKYGIFFDPPYDIKNIYNNIPENGEVLFLLYNMSYFGVAIHSAMKKNWQPKFEFVLDCTTSWYTPNRPLERHKGLAVFGDFKYNFDNAIYYDGKNREPKMVNNTRGEYNWQPIENGKHLSSVEKINYARTEKEHVHQKPVEWISAIFRGCAGERILDPFLGSGSTLIACEKTDRTCYGLEIAPKYIDVIVQRYINYVKSNEDVYLIRDGKKQSHSEIFING